MLNTAHFEIKARAANIPISSAFWLIGNHFEVDTFEHYWQNSTNGH